VFPTEEFDEQCKDIVQEIVTGPTVALKHSKDLLQEGGDRTFDEAIEAEVEALGTVFETEDFSEGVNAFVERRTPEFEGR
jgi:enoyl-CoA hydratase/carnithine racemase